MVATRAQLIWIPSSGVGHLVSAVEIAKLLVERDDRLSITLLVLNPPRASKSNPFAELLASVSSSTASAAKSQIRFQELPYEDDPSGLGAKSNMSLAERHKPQVRAAVAELTRALDSPPLAGFIIDMFCTPMIDVANEFGVPSYMFFTCSAAFLGFMFHVLALQDDEGKDLSEFKDSDAKLDIPTLVNPLPAKVFPTVVLDEEHRVWFLGAARRFRETKGIVINSFEKLEPNALKSLLGDDKIPPVYPVGPILNLEVTGRSDKSSEILSWLDAQPSSSVVFLCFGSVGSFHDDQVNQIAHGLEKSGHRFLLSLRRPPPTGMLRAYPEEYENLAKVLPEGFLERTSERGKVIGWAPQVEVLAHPSVGGFVTHCGWNSTLESLWFGVPIAAWPLYAEQQFNAFMMVVEHGMAVEVKMDYRNDLGMETKEIVDSEVIEKAVQKLMKADGHDEKKEKVRQMSERSREALAEGDSSHLAIGRFIGDVFKNIP
ncbi:anthocyanidin 3-O-glucosyltransferase 2-like [Punica granatum]|uniref:Glycosyltransferase n=2 Tax=Punica granatum TaxID=22663 RepID=A0A218XA44_PUNGR|nr:anthocyanidin 3-O-glucosyltransferase 2-like [Punica granatum]OWM81556.1 hypothetical protein CDL15_Pgr007594 [Punica granatum]PKI41051.1 hypothetical protein CRG98_038579 [Punica granatum]